MDRLGNVLFELTTKINTEEYVAGVQKITKVNGELIQSLKNTQSQLSGSFSKETSSTAAAINQTSSAVDKSQKKWSDHTKTIIAAGLGFTSSMGLVFAINKTREAIGGSVKDWADYQNAMLQVSTLVDTSKVNMGELSDQVVELSGKYGKDKKGLASALYESLSAGIEAGQSMQFLDTATRAAIGGVTDAKTVVDGLTSSLAAYGQDANKAEEYSDSLFVTIKVGKTTMDELSGTIGQVAPLASAAGMSFDELGASIATLTLSGLSTSEAGTAMRGMLNAIIQPSEDAKKMAKELGIEFDITAVKSKGFAKWLEELMLKTGGSTKALALLFPEVRGLNGAIQLTGDGFNRFNKTMDEMTKKAGATTEAANKMKEALNYKWETAINNFKNTGSSIGQYLEGPLKSALDTYNTLSQALNQGNRNMKVLSMNPNDMTLEQLKERLKVTKDTQTEVERSEEARIKRMSSLGNDPFFGNVNKEKILSQSKLVSDINAEVNALETLIRKKEVAAQGETLYNKEKADAAIAEQDRIDKQKADAVKIADAKAREIEDGKKNAEEASKNATVLQQIEDDRLRATEKTTSLTSDASKQEVEDRKKAAEAIQRYDQIAFNQQSDFLQNIIDDESQSSEVRQRAVEKLFKVKKDSAVSAKNFEIGQLKETTEQERIEYEQKNQTIENYIAELENNYNKAKADIENSTLLNKQELVDSLNSDLNLRKQSLYDIEWANKKSFDKTEKNAKQTATNIENDFKNKLNQDYKVAVKTAIDIEIKGNEKGLSGATSIFGGLIADYKTLQEAFTSGDTKALQKFGYDFQKDATKAAEDVTKDLKKLKNNIVMGFSDLFGTTTNIVLKSIKNIRDDTSLGVEGLVSDVGHAVGSAGEAAGNAWVAAIGGIVGGIGDVLSFMDSELDMWGHQEKEKEKQQKEYNDNLMQGIDLTIRKTKDWLKLIDDTDLSNKSVVELKQQKKNVADKMASDISSATGVKGFSGEDWATLSDVMQRPAYKNNSSPDELLKNGYISQSEYDLIKRIKTDNSDLITGEPGNKGLQPFYDMMKMTIKSSSSEMNSLNSAIGNRQGTASIDHTKSTTKEDFLADLQTELDTGRISETEYKKQLYEASWGLGGYADKMWGADKVVNNFNPEEQARYEYDYKKANDKEDGDSGVKIFGADEASTYQTTPKEAVSSQQSAPISLVGDVFHPSETALNSLVSDSALANAMMSTTTINNKLDVEIKIDPNIPITQDTARAYSEQIASSVQRLLNSKGR